MVSVPNATPDKPSPVPNRDLTFLIEPEPWLRVFLRNLGDLFGATPPKVWLTSQPGEYWADALVNRPVPWGELTDEQRGFARAVEHGEGRAQ